MGIRGNFCAAALAAAIVTASGTAWAAGFTPVVTGLSSPFGVATDASGNLFIADINFGVYESPAPGYGTKTPLAGGQFGRPFGIAVDRQGNVFVTDDSDQSVKEIPAPGYTTINTLASGFTGLQGIAVDANDNLFVDDGAARTIYELKASNYANKIVITTGVVAPFGVALDAQANLWVTSETNNLFNIYEFYAASGYRSSNLYGQPEPFPQGIAIDAQGNVFFDTNANTVFKAVNPGSLVVTPVAGGFRESLGIALDGRGNIFVADGSAGAIEEIGGGAPLAPVPALAPGGLALLSLLLGGTGWWVLRRRGTA